MSISEILIPFSLPPAELAKDLLPALMSKCGTDGLALLLSRHRASRQTLFENFSPLLPHEIWLNNYLEKQYQTSLVQHTAQSFRIQLDPGYWFLLNPIHLHVARTHLVLTDYRQLALSEADSQLLFDMAKTICDDNGVTLVYGDASTWLLRRDDWVNLVTPTPDAACGHNIETWSVNGSKELDWRKLQNEIQMAWFTHPLQQRREDQHQKVINGLWLWGGSWIRNKPGDSPHRPFILHAKNTQFNQDFTLSPPLILLDQLTSSALSSSWDEWLNAMTDLENHWFRPLCSALKKRERELTHCRLYLSNTNTLLSVQTSSITLKKFWRPANFNFLFN